MRGPRHRGIVGWLLGWPEPPPATRLDAAAVVALAKDSAAVRELGRSLPTARARRQDDRVVWRVSSGGIGAQWWVEVDDATGEVSDVHHAPGR